MASYLDTCEVISRELAIRKRFGKNAILQWDEFWKGATARSRADDIRHE